MAQKSEEASKMSEKNTLFRKGEKAAKLSALVLFALGALKGIVALLSGSVALLTSTIDSFSDIFSSIAIWVGLKLVQKKPTERFPYGYYNSVFNNRDIKHLDPQGIIRKIF